MTMINRAGLADELMAADASGHADAAYWGAVLWDARHEIAAAFRQPDQKGEATDEPVAWLCRDNILDDTSVTTDAATAIRRLRRPESEWTVTPLYASPQPAPEAGKLPSEEAVFDFLKRWFPGERDGYLRVASDSVLALLSPAQPHDVDAVEWPPGQLEKVITVKPRGGESYTTTIGEYLQITARASRSTSGRA